MKKSTKRNILYYLVWLAITMGAIQVVGHQYKDDTEPIKEISIEAYEELDKTHQIHGVIDGGSVQLNKGKVEVTMYDNLVLEKYTIKDKEMTTQEKEDEISHYNEKLANVNERWKELKGLITLMLVIYVVGLVYLLNKSRKENTHG